MSNCICLQVDQITSKITYSVFSIFIIIVRTKQQKLLLRFHSRMSFFVFLPILINKTKAEIEVTIIENIGKEDFVLERIDSSFHCNLNHLLISIFFIHLIIKNLFLTSFDIFPSLTKENQTKK